jgi:hypothetical protein
MGQLLRDQSTSRESYFVSRAPILVPNVTAYKCSAFDSGKTHIVPDLTATITIDLPPVENGLEFEFIYGGVAADAQNWIIRSLLAANFFKGGVVHLDLDAGSGADELIPVFPNGTTNAKITHTTPQGGTALKFTCDGTNWYVNGYASSNTAPAFADLP